MTEGRVVLVGTPIGNLGDLSPRARESLAGAAVIFCEDTRRTRKLLSAAGIPAPRLVAMHQHNESAASAEALALACGGGVVAVVSDAGMPGISDPGTRLVALAAGEGVPVEVVPGPAAFLTALVGSGLPTARFCFEGFLPRRGRERTERLRAISAEARTTVLYESPRRVAATLADLSSACGHNRRVALGRELTKLHEEFWRGRLGDALEWVEAGEPRGEWVIVLDGAAPEPITAGEEEITSALRRHLAAGETRRTAVDAVAAELSIPRRQVYELAINQARDQP
ncbi:MAG TPA: 16S rRNA (cytidine(1402)-2'-O)-methyltransferase [Acidimicrobiales bacterium]|nr:16S rRNA (cytidine(1402)-2'-O)-methyltransferase [Acidimicrobiales bacterium]